MSGRSRAYDGAVGTTFAARAAAVGLNSLHERPAVVALMGDVTGQDVADLGCGAGQLAALLTQAGGRVTAVDGSEVLVDLAQRNAPQARVVHHDLDEALTFLDTHSMDGVVCSLVIHHLADRPAFLGEVCRILRPGGWLVLSTTHPTADWGYFGGSYFDQRWVSRSMGEETIEYQLMTMSTLVNEVIAAGFVLDTMVEPQPSDMMRQLDPERFEQLRTDPIFVVLRAHTPRLPESPTREERAQL